jgi:aminoglycoside phosphotransferase (APT) family kinase protein
MNSFADLPFVRDIAGANQWIYIQPVKKGDSHDRKYEVRDHDDHHYLIRMADRTQYDKKKQEFNLLHILYNSELPVPQPIRHGLCGKGRFTYLMTRWIDGKTGYQRLPEHDQVMQYVLGHEIGVYLQVMHTCEVSERERHWSCLIDQEIQQLEKQCSKKDLRLVCIQRLFRFVRDHQSVTRHRPQAVLHGDLHAGNLVFSAEQSVSFIDFEKWKIGDPLSDLAPVMTDIQLVSRWFSVGFLDGYFQYQVGVRHFRLIAYYVALYILKKYLSIRPEYTEARRSALKWMRTLMKDFNGFRQVVPAWYKEMPRMERK